VEEKKENIENEVKKKEKHILLKILYVLAFLFIISDVFLYFFATPLLKNYLQEKVKQETKGLFSIDFDKISIEIGFRLVSLENFKMISDSTVYKNLIIENKVKAALYNISCSSIELRGTSVFKLFYRQELKIKELKLNNPIVELKKLPKKDDVKKRDFVHEDLFPAISPYLNEISIKTISLNNGKFNLNIDKDSTKKTTHVGFISVKLIDFLLNKNQYLKKEKLFYSEDINIQINDYKIKLSDNIHYLFADNIFLSTKKSLLRAELVGVNPISNSKQYLNKLEHNYYRLNASLIELKNFDIYKLYFDKDIEIQQIIVENPKINLINKYKTDKKSKIKRETKEIDLYKLIENKFVSIKIDSLKIKRSIFNYYYNSDIENKVTYRAENLNLKLYNFVLNKDVKNDKSKIFYSNNIYFDLKSFSASIPNNVHKLQVGNIKANTLKKELIAKNIEFSKKKFLREGLSGKTVFNVNIPNLELQGINYKDFYHNRKVFLQNVNFSSSNIDAVFYKKKDKKGKEASVLQDLFSGFVKNIFISNFNIQKSKFKLKILKNDSVFQYYSGKVIFNLRSFNLNKYKSSNKQKLFFADGFRLQLFDYKQDLGDFIHILKLDEVTISSFDSLLYISKFSISPKDKLKTYKDFKQSYINKIYNFTISNSKITGIDINKAAFDSVLNIKQIFINNPKLIYSNYIDIKNLSDSLFVKKNNIQNSAIIVDDIDKNTDSLKLKSKLISLLSKRYSIIDIKTFNLRKGLFQFFEVDSNINVNLMMAGKISVRLKDFKFDSNQFLLKDKFSYSDNIQFAVDNFQSLMSDKNYQLKINRLVFSSKDSVFVAKVVTLFPKPKIYKNEAINNVFTIYTPRISTFSTNIGEFINFNILDFGKLTIENPAIALFRKKGTNKNNNGVDRNKKSTIKFPFKNIKFEKIKLTNGVFGILKNKNDFNKLSINTKFNFEIKNFEIDSNKLQNPKLLFKNLNAIAQFKKLHYQMPDSIHFLDVKKIELNTLDSKITGDSFLYYNVEADNVFRDFNKNHIDKVLIPKFYLKGLNLANFFINKFFNLDSLRITKPVIEIADYKTTKTDFKLNKLNLYKKIYPKLNAINISKIVIDSASLKLTANNKVRKFGNNFDNLFANISNIKIDSLHQIRKNKILNADDICLSIKDYQINLGDSLYNLKIKEIGISTALHKLYLDLIALNPNITRDKFAEKIKKEFVLLYLFGKKIIAKDIDFESFFNDKKIIIGNIDLYDFNLHAYKSKKYPLDSILKIALPLDYVRKLNNYLFVDTIRIKRSYIGFEMLEKDAIKSGVIDLTNLEGVMTNITNDTNKIKKGESTKLNLSTYIMNKGLMSVSFNFPLNSKFGEYNYAGTIDSMDLRVVNSFLKNVLSATIKNGHLNGVEFNIDANKDFAIGKMKLSYNNLKVSIINKKKTDSLIVNKRGLVSLLANSIIKSSNPKFKNGRVKEKRIYYERYIYKPVFYYWTQSLLAGAKNTLGFKSKDLKERLKFEKITSRFNEKNKKKYKKTDKREKKNTLKEAKKHKKERKKEEKKNLKQMGKSK